MSDQILIEALIKKLGVQAKFEANLSSGYDHTHNHKQTDKHRLVKTKHRRSGSKSPLNPDTKLQ